MTGKGVLGINSQVGNKDKVSINTVVKIFQRIDLTLAIFTWQNKVVSNQSCKNMTDVRLALRWKILTIADEKWQKVFGHFKKTSFLLTFAHFCFLDALYSLQTVQNVVFGQLWTAIHQILTTANRKVIFFKIFLVFTSISTWSLHYCFIPSIFFMFYWFKLRDWGNLSYKINILKCVRLYGILQKTKEGKKFSSIKWIDLLK